MPEGPEIQLAADEVTAALGGQPTTGVFFAFQRLKPFEPLLTGQTVETVEARGKAMLIRFGNGLNVYSHNQLYGKWLVTNAHNYPDTNRQLRLAIHNRRKSALLYSASEIEILRNNELETHPFLSKLGPNPLDESVTVKQIQDRLLDPSFRRRRLTSLLLDQSFLAGIGNYLRSEVLFAGQTHPSLRPTDCSPEQVKQLAKAAIELPRQSYQTGGITTDLELAEMLRRQGASRQQYRFWVFGRGEEPCYRCGTSIIKDEVGGRRLYFCPTCQKLNPD